MLGGLCRGTDATRWSGTHSGDDDSANVEPSELHINKFEKEIRIASSSSVLFPKEKTGG